MSKSKKLTEGRKTSSLEDVEAEREGGRAALIYSSGVEGGGGAGGSFCGSWKSSPKKGKPD
jgi:hypothetical protein